ncbi:hypothetical protein D3C78_1012250 [compost metagenome]
MHYVGPGYRGHPAQEQIDADVSATPSGGGDAEEHQRYHQCARHFFRPFNRAVQRVAPNHRGEYHHHVNQQRQCATPGGKAGQTAA